MENPFTPGSGAPPPYLAGRENHISTYKKMLKNIEDGHNENLILTGLRGTGKTTLIGEFEKIAKQNNFLPIKRIQFSKKYCNPDEFVNALKYDCRKIVENISKQEKVKNKLKSAGSYLKPKQFGFMEAYYEPSYEKSNKPPFEDDIKDYLSNNWKVFEKAGFKGVIFLYDEFHNVADISNKDWSVLSDYIGSLNELQNDGYRYHVVLTGLPNLHLNVKKARTYSERMFNALKVENLSEKEAKDAITKPLDKSKYSFAKPLVKKLVDETGQYPFFIQFYCKEIIARVEKTNITIKDYEKIKNHIIKQLEQNFFDPRMEDLAPQEKEVLFAMSKISSENMSLKEISEKSKIPTNSLFNLLKRLETKGMIYNYTRGNYKFSVPLLKEYLVRNS